MSSLPAEVKFWPSCAECFGNMGRRQAPAGSILMRCEQCGHGQVYTVVEMVDLQPALAAAYDATIRIQRQRFPDLFRRRR